VADDLAIQSPLSTAGMLDTIPLNTANLAPGAAKDRAAVKAAKDFESVLLHRLLEEMRKTVPDSELLDSPASDQMMSMFYMYLAQDTAQKGGLGLWKQIYQQMKPVGSENHVAPPPSAEPSVRGNGILAGTAPPRAAVPQDPNAYDAGSDPFSDLPIGSGASLR
jgi:Rod binding domain-containing protein